MGEMVSLGSRVRKLFSTPVSKRKSIFTPRKTTVKCGGFRSVETETVDVESLTNGVIHLIWKRKYFAIKNGKDSSFFESATLVIASNSSIQDRPVFAVDI